MLMLLWTAAILPAWDSEVNRYRNWTVYPLQPLILIVPVWHFLLVATQRPRLRFLLYAVIHVPIFLYLWMYCIIFITGEFL